MSAGPVCAENSVIIDAVVSADTGEVCFEIYTPDDLGNQGIYARLSTALLEASERIGFSAESEAILEITYREG